MTYTVHITEKAEQDILAAVDYIEFTLFNPQAADNLLGAIEKAINPLSEMPLIHSLIEDPILSSHQIRFLPVNNYIMFYAVNEKSKTVNILRFLYEKRNWEEILNS